MEIFREEKAEDFLEKEGFEVIERVFVKKRGGVESAVEGVGFPCVMKISGEKIIHKNRVGGVETGVESVEEALKIFDRFSKIKGFEGVMIQKQIKGEEFLLGVKKTPEFGHVVAFGAGGVNTEKLGDVSFRVCPFEEQVAKEMLGETKIGKNCDEKVVEILLKLCKVVEKYPKIKELDINPLINNKIVDARIVFD